MPTPNTIVVPSNPNTEKYATTYVGSAVALAGALTALNGVGGVICLIAEFTITTALTIPEGVLLLSRYGGMKLTIGTGGSLTLAAKSELRDITIVSGKTSGNLVVVPNTRSLVRGCFFRVTNADSVTCMYVTGSYNRFLQNTFTGVVGVGPATGIEYAAGVDNIDQDSYFE